MQRAGNGKTSGARAHFLRSLKCARCPLHKGDAAGENSGVKNKEEKSYGRKEKVQARAAAQAHHRHHRRHPVRPVPAGGLLPLCGNALVVLQPVPVVHHSADDPRLRYHGYREPQERRGQAAAHHGRSRLLLDPHRRLGFVLRVRHPVPALHERRCARQDRRNRRQLA